MATRRTVIFLLVGAALLTGAWALWTPRVGNQQGAEAGVTVTSDPFFKDAPVREGLRKYQSLIFSFTLWVPQELVLKEYNKANTTTLVFQDPKTHAGFQIFVVPYQGTQVSEDRFKMDLPSGVREQATAIVVDGTPASLFYGTDAAFGATREVWFIKNGLLYEVTTYRELDQWLAQIMQTWKFL